MQPEKLTNRGLEFAGYAFWSFILAVLRKHKLKSNKSLPRPYSQENEKYQNNSESSGSLVTVFNKRGPILMYICLALIRAADLAFTNLSLKYLNYPAKTLIKSSRVIFTMIVGLCIGRKRYTSIEYVMALTLVAGLGIFCHADMNSNAVFHPLGVFLLVSTIFSFFYQSFFDSHNRQNCSIKC